jgi:hypothetical protein
MSGRARGRWCCWLNPVPSGPAKAVTNWKEYAHDDRVLTPSSTGFDRPRSGGSFLGSLADIWAMTRRNLVHISREPMQLSDVTIQPVLFTCCSSTSSAAPSRFRAVAATRTSCWPASWP